MTPIIRLQTTPDTVRVELLGEGLLLEDDATIALQYSARTEPPFVVALGKNARTMLEKLPTVGCAGAGEEIRLGRVVPVEEAPWWKHAESPSWARPPIEFDPLDHTGEIVTFRPFALATSSLQGGTALLQSCRWRALGKEAQLSMSTMRRWLLRWFAIVDVQLPEDYLRAHGHDAVVRALWSDVGARVTLNGRRPVLETPRHISDLSWQEWGRILVAIALPAVHFIQCALFERPLNPRVVLLLAVLGIGLAYTLLSSALRFGPDDPLSRETLATASRPRSTLRRYKALGPNDDPAAYAGSRAYLLGMCGVLPMVALTIVFLGAIRVGFVATRLSQDPKPSAVVLFAWIASMAVGTVLSHYLTSMRLSVGERGLTLQPEGLLGPRLFIPFANIRSVVATQGIWRVGAKLWLVFRDGSDVRYGPMLSVIPFASPARVLRAVEEAIQQRLPARAKHAAVVPAATNT